MTLYLMFSSLPLLNHTPYYNRIDENWVIKVANFGLSEVLIASNNYFTNRQSKRDVNIKLPVKWMAPESLRESIFSEKSDVVWYHLFTFVQIVSSYLILLQWSYEVTCREIFSAGRSPYPGVHPMTLIWLGNLAMA